jgi:hypothetical protein
LGLVVFQVGVGECVEFLLGLAGEDLDGGAEAVLEGVEAGFGLAFLGLRPGGMLGVFPVLARPITCGHAV